MNTLADRIRERMSALQLTQEAVAKRAGITQTTVHKLVTGKAQTTRKGPELARVLECDLDWLLTGKGRSSTSVKIEFGLGPTRSSPPGAIPTPELAEFAYGPPQDLDAIAKHIAETDSAPDYSPYVDIPLYQVELAAGHGTEPEFEEIHNQLQFRRDWLAKKGLSPNKVSVVFARGDSMEPRIQDGDVLLINRADTAPVDGRVYAIRWDGGLLVKRLIRQLDSWVLRSDNRHAAYEDKEIPANRLEELRIIGRVVWVGGGM